MESKIRKDHIDFVKDNLINANDDTILKICTKINDVLNCEENYVSDFTTNIGNDYSRFKCITAIENNLT
jgi:hypothetical protein